MIWKLCFLWCGLLLTGLFSGCKSHPPFKVPAEALEADSYAIKEYSYEHDAEGLISAIITKTTRYEGEKAPFLERHTRKEQSFNSSDSISERRFYNLIPARALIETENFRYSEHGITLSYAIKGSGDTLRKEARYYNEAGNFKFAKSLFFNKGQPVGYSISELEYSPGNQLSIINSVEEAVTQFHKVLPPGKYITTRIRLQC